MTRVVPVRDEEKRLRVLSTYVATLSLASLQGHVYFSRVLKHLLDEILTPGIR